jgi:hypothetical protein
MRVIRTLGIGLVLLTSTLALAGGRTFKAEKATGTIKLRPGERSITLRADQISTSVYQKRGVDIQQVFDTISAKGNKLIKLGPGTYYTSARNNFKVVRERTQKAKP